ncbi:MAG: tetratricopeptide repeat protein [Lachnospiraceae bacterium]|nr:tetratricopeptide repeat protein [Lachnospiraceae bacterium]
MSTDRRRKRRRRRKRINRQAQIIFRSMFVIILVPAIIISALHLFSKKNKYRETGLKLYNEGQYEEAITYFDKSLDCKQWFTKKMDVDSLMYKADAHIHLAEYYKAYEAYDTILTKYKKRYYDKDKVNELSVIAITLDSYSNGNYKDEAPVFAKLVDYGYVELSLYAGHCYEMLGDDNNMLKYYDIYTGAFGFNQHLANRYATLYMFREDYNKALSYIESNLDGNGDEQKDLLYNQILCYTKLGDYDRALSLAESFINIYPDDKRGKDIYEFVYTRVNVNPHVVHDIYDLNDN